jgi:hypothetical protein
VVWMGGQDDREGPWSRPAGYVCRVKVILPRTRGGLQV